MENGNSQKPGICMFLSAYYPEGFGGSHQCRALIQSLNGRFRIHVLTTSLSPGRFKEYATVDGVEVFRVRVWRSLILNLLCSAPQIIWTFLRLSSRIQIVHCHGVTSKNYLIVLLAKLLGKKVMQKFTSFGFDDPLTLEKQPLWKLKQTLWTQCDCFLGISPAFSKSFARSSLRKNRYLEIQNGVDLRRFCPVDSEQAKRNLREKLDLPLESNIVLFVGFFSKEKGVEDLFFAWRDLIHGENADLVLVLVGARNLDYSEISKEIVDGIQRLIEKEGLSSRVFFQEETEWIEEYYHAADLFVLPSYREGLPNVLLEAMACGLPVITSRLAGVTDSIVEEGKSGLFFEVGNREMLKARVQELLSDSSLAETLGKNARKKTENDYDIKKVAELHASLYEELIQCAVSRVSSN